MVEQIEHPERFLPPEQRTYGPIDTKGLSPALLTDNGILGLAYNLVTGSVETQTAAWARRLAKKVHYWSRREKPTRNVKMLLQNIAPIIDADLSVLNFLKEEELPAFVMTVRELQRKRLRSLGSYQRRYHLPEAFINPVPPETRLMTREFYRRMHQDWQENNPRPFITRLWQGIQELSRVVPALLAFPSVALVSAGLMGYSQPEPPTPLLKDQARVQPAPDLTTTASLAVTKAHEIAQVAIARATLAEEELAYIRAPERPTIILRLVDPDLIPIENAEVTFDGETIVTNKIGRILIQGKTPVRKDLSTKGTIKIKLPSGVERDIELDYHGDYNTTLLNPFKEFLIVPRSIK